MRCIEKPSLAKRVSSVDRVPSWTAGRYPDWGLTTVPLLSGLFPQFCYRSLKEDVRHEKKQF